MSNANTDLRPKVEGPKSIPKFSTPQTIVTITVDKDTTQQTFYIHKNVISHYSPFFATAFTSRFLEGEIQTMSIEDIEAPIFGFFVNWLYAHRIVTPDGHPLRLIEYAKLWVLADRFVIPHLVSLMLREARRANPDKVAGGGNTLVNFQTYAYSASMQGLMSESPLKQLAIEKKMRVVTLETRREMIDQFPEGMLADFTEAVLAKRGIEVLRRNGIVEEAARPKYKNPWKRTSFDELGGRIVSSTPIMRE